MDSKYQLRCLVIFTEDRMKGLRELCTEEFVYIDTALSSYKKAYFIFSLAYSFLVLPSGIFLKALGFDCGLHLIFSFCIWECMSLWRSRRAVCAEHMLRCLRKHRAKPAVTEAGCLLPGCSFCCCWRSTKASLLALCAFLYSEFLLTRIFSLLCVHTSQIALLSSLLLGIYNVGK